VSFTDPGDQPRGSRKPGVKAPEPTSLFDISDQPPDTPIQVKSSTSIDAAKETRATTMSKRRADVFHAVKGSPDGLARFQIAARLGIPDHWCSSSVDALIKQRKIEEHPTATVINPKSGKSCAVLVAIVTAEEAAA
jgi:hypothetical protein